MFSSEAKGYHDFQCSHILMANKTKCFKLEYKGKSTTSLSSTAKCVN